jgi:hypothetical protein
MLLWKRHGGVKVVVHLFRARQRQELVASINGWTLS